MYTPCTRVRTRVHVFGQHVFAPRIAQEPEFENNVDAARACVSADRAIPAPRTHIEGVVWAAGTRSAAVLMCRAAGRRGGGLLRQPGGVLVLGRSRACRGVW